MAGAYVQSANNDAASVTSVAVSLTGVGLHNHLVATTLAWESVNPTILTPTSSPSTTWNVGQAAFSDTGHDTMAIHYAEDTASGSWTVTFRTNTSAYINGILSESSGIALTASIGAVNHTSGSSAVSSVQPGSITPAAGSIVYTATMDSSSLTTADSVNQSFVVRGDINSWDGANTVRGGVASLDNVAGSALNPTWTLPSGTATMSAAIIEFLAAGGGGGGGGLPFFMQGELLTGGMQELGGAR